MDQETIMIEAIELNVRTLIKSHPRAANFIKTLQNEAIDQAFQETNLQIKRLTARMDCMALFTNDTLKQKIENLEAAKNGIIHNFIKPMNECLADIRKELNDALKRIENLEGDKT